MSTSGPGSWRAHNPGCSSRLRVDAAPPGAAQAQRRRRLRPRTRRERATQQSAHCVSPARAQVPTCVSRCQSTSESPPWAGSRKSPTARQTASPELARREQPVRCPCFPTTTGTLRPSPRNQSATPLSCDERSLGCDQTGPATRHEQGRHSVRPTVRGAFPLCDAAAPARKRPEGSLGTVRSSIGIRRLRIPRRHLVARSRRSSECDLQMVRQALPSSIGPRLAPAFDCRNCSRTSVSIFCHAGEVLLTAAWIRAGISELVSWPGSSPAG